MALPPPTGRAQQEAGGSTRSHTAARMRPRMGSAGLPAPVSGDPLHPSAQLCIPGCAERSAVWRLGVRRGRMRLLVSRAGSGGAPVPERWRWGGGQASPPLCSAGSWWGRTSTLDISGWSHKPRAALVALLLKERAEERGSLASPCGGSDAPITRCPRPLGIISCSPRCRCPAARRGAGGWAAPPAPSPPGCRWGTPRTGR